MTLNQKEGTLPVPDPQGWDRTLGDTARHTGLRVQTLHWSCSHPGDGDDDDDDTRETQGTVRLREHFGVSAASSNMLPKPQKILMHQKRMFSRWRKVLSCLEVDS